MIYLPFIYTTPEVFNNPHILYLKTHTTKENFKLKLSHL